MENSFIEKAVEVKAPKEQVWRVFTTPELTRQLGGEYVTDWHKGSTLSWKGVDGAIQTHGIILQLEPGKLLRHNLLNPKNKRQIISVITYRFHQVNDITTIYAREEFNTPLKEKEYADALVGWDTTLKAVKETAEKLQTV